ncbi:hypothetical protein D9M71_477970 [compost metagenome]
MTARQMQIIRDPRAIGQVSHRQFMTDGKAQHLAQTSRFIQFSQNAAGEPAALVTVISGR